MRTFNFNHPITILILTFSGETIIDCAETFRNLDHFNTWAKDQLSEVGAVHIFLSQMDYKMDYIMSY